MGALVTLQLMPDSPMRSYPWIITFGPLTDEEDWEPVVCGPYEHPHAIALAEEVVADDELMAVVEPVMGFAAPGEIRAEIAASRAAAEAKPDGLHDDDDFDNDLDVTGGHGDETGLGAPLPSADEIRAGMVRVAQRLATSG
jgi:hypothetical protein